MPTFLILSDELVIRNDVGVFIIFILIGRQFDV